MLGNSQIIILSLTLVLGLFSVSDVFAELDYNDIDIKSTSTVLFEKSDSNIIVATIQLTNNSNEEFSSYGNNFYLVSSGKYFEEISSYEVEIGSKVCPTNDDISAGVSKEIILCYEVPKNLSNSSYTIEMTDGFSREYCEDIKNNQYFDSCQTLSKSIKSAVKTNYDEYIKKFIIQNTDIKVDFNSIDLIEQKGFSVLKIDFDVTNLSSDQINYYSSNVFAITPDGISYSPERYDLTDVGYERDACRYSSIEINPKLTKSYSYCFEVPQGNTIFDLAIRDGIFSSCDGGYSDCVEYVLNISSPNIVSMDQEPTPAPTPEPKQTTESNELRIAEFVDRTKDPQSYVDRYNNEPAYKKWFDDNYPEYDSIVQAVGLELTQKIPDWVKNIFGWYAADQVSEDELLNAIKYLINEKILIVN